MSEEYVHEDEIDDSTDTGVLSLQTIDLADCKELEQPFPLQASLCRKGVCVIMKDSPAKISELKISKTGKHGSSKANMVGYDVITNKKYQETQPGHATMFSYEMKKFEYEVVDIIGNDITAITPDGVEKYFKVPAAEHGDHGTKLVADFKANAAKGGDQFFIITVLYAPRMVGSKWVANMYVESYKLGQNE
jgi:translation elongation factor P/translation initiation factor 5A